jgi:protein-S-isoprenylcysteine O-methyltransferase Ste14
MTPFYIVYALWIFSEILINRLFKSKTTDKKGLDKNTLGWIWIAIAISCTVAVIISTNIALPIVHSEIISFVGLALILIGCLMRIIVIRSLGKEFTSDVTIRENHQLKTSGFYQFVRHPSYSFSLLSFIGFGLSLNNWLSLIIVTLTILYVFGRRIVVEEAALVSQFGDAYVQYRRRTSRLVPFIY